MLVKTCLTFFKIAIEKTHIAVAIDEEDEDIELCATDIDQEVKTSTRLTQ